MATTGVYSVCMEHKKKKLTAPAMANIRKAFSAHLAARDLAQKSTHVQNSYRDILRDDLLPTYGEEDTDGNLWIFFPEEDPVVAPDGTPLYGIKRQVSVRVALDAEAAEALIRKKGLERKCLRKVTYYEVDEDALLSLAYSDPDIISGDEISGLYVSSEPTYSFIQVKKPR